MKNLEKETKFETKHILAMYGEGVYQEYRIPGLIVTQKETLIYCYEGRKETCNDWAQIDIILGRSSDGGETFTEQKIASSKQGEICTYNNPVLIADGDKVHLVFHKNYETAYYCYSEDDGITFSEPVEITDAFKEFTYTWNVCASGPGHGIATRAGRLLIPIWLANGEVLDLEGRKKRHQPSVSGAIYSDDRGKSWHAGVLVNGIYNANETTIVQCADNSILFNFRNEEKSCCRILGVSPDGIQDFTKVWFENKLEDPKCFGSMVQINKEKLAFINCANQKLDPISGDRVFLTIHESIDRGQNWKEIILVDKQGGYADIAVCGDKLYTIYEQSSWQKEYSRVDHLILKKYKL